MAWRAAVTMGIPHRLVKAQEIAQGALSCNPPALLLAPGGTARLKVRALGGPGADAVRAYVAGGGRYLGFCGGAGLGLSGGGLGLCPWSRAAYTDRMQHLVSGHVLARPGAGALRSPERAGTLLSLPVWWPGRFAPSLGDGVEVLAAYERPGPDLCVADIPLASLPQDIFGAWQAMYGVNMRADFLAGQPCVIGGRYGDGGYMLSYSHLETPDSPDANRWLAHTLRQWAGFAPVRELLPRWEVERLPARWPQEPETAPLFEARGALARLMALGEEHRLLFRRASWLYGWRTGIPGAALNSLYASLATALSLEPTPEAREFWRSRRQTVVEVLPLFAQGVEGYLLAERLATTLASSLPHVVDRRGLNAQREALFGPPMDGGGLYQELVNVVDELMFLLARETAD